MTILPPRDFSIGASSIRATMSTPEPAGKPMMMVIGCAPGQDCAAASPGSMERKARNRMNRTAYKFIALIIAGCASYSGSGLVPGQSSVDDVVAVMGQPALIRDVGGEKVYWYPRLPMARESFAARIDPQGTLIAIEQRLAPEYISRIIPNKSTSEDVLDILGPPYRIYPYPRMQREAWEYQLRTPPTYMNLYVQVSPDHV